MKKKILAALALVMALVTVLLSGCCISSDGDSGSGGGKNVISEILNTNPIEGVDVFNGERFDEMVWGYYELENYKYDGSNESTAEFREGMKYATYAIEGINEPVSILPLTMQFGKNSHFLGSFTYEGEYYDAYTELGRSMFRKAYMEEVGDLSEEDFQKIEQILDLDVAEVYFVNESGRTLRGAFIYELKGDTISLYNTIIGDDYSITKDAKPFAEYYFLHDGGKLTLANDGIQRNYMADGYKADDPSLSVSGYALNKNNTYEDLAGFSMSQYGDGEEISVYAYLTNGYEPVDPVMELNKADGTFTLSWDECWNLNWDKVADARTITGKFIPCTSYGFTDYTGFILIIDGKCYRYLMSQQEYEEKMFGSMYDANISESTMVELDKKKRDILAELEAAFKAAGLDVEIDTDSGKVGVEANFLFDTNSYELNTAGKQYIDTFVDVYTSVVLNGEHADYVAAIVVEGHTDTKGSYSYNQTLSQNRADAVAAQCIGRNPGMASMIRTSGCSYDYPVYKDDGTVDMERSRRVTFSFLLTAN